MSSIRRFDHVGITVADLDTVAAFFVGLGFEVEGRMFMEGEFVDTVIGIPNSRSEILTLVPLATLVVVFTVSERRKLCRPIECSALVP